MKARAYSPLGHYGGDDRMSRGLATIVARAATSSRDPSGSTPVVSDPCRSPAGNANQRDCQLNGSGTEEVVPTGSADQDPLAQQGKAGPSIHLPLQELELGVGAFDGSVAVGQAEPGDDGVRFMTWAMSALCHGR